MARTTGDCVVLVHGLGNHRSFMAVMEQHLRESGHTVVNWSYASLSKTITEAADALRTVYDLNARYYPTVHFVTQSMGGLVVRRFLKRYEPRTPAHLGKIVMIGPPNNGSQVARTIVGNPSTRFLIDSPAARWFFGPSGRELCDGGSLNERCAVPESGVMVMAGTGWERARTPVSLVGRRVLEQPHDGTVTVAETRLPVMERFLTVHEAHDALPLHPTVLAETRRFLSRNPEAEPPVPEVRQWVRDVALISNALSVVARESAICRALPPMPNIPHRPLDGGVFWKDIAMAQGWRLQENTLLGHYRLLDAAHVQRAWGGREYVTWKFQDFTRTTEEKPVGVVGSR